MSQKNEKYFNIQYCKQLYEGNKSIIIKDPSGKDILVKDITKATDYIQKFFFPLTNGLICIKEGNNYRFEKQHVVITAIFNKLPKDLRKWFTYDYDRVRRIVNKVNKPKITDEYINTFNGFKHKKVPYESYPDNVKQKINIMNDYIKEILASNNNEQFDYNKAQDHTRVR